MSRFKVLQFNMQFGQSWNDADPDHAPVDLDLTIAEIRKHNADIILLQEVEHARSCGARLDPPVNYTRLRSELGSYDGFFPLREVDPRELPFGIGLAIFSKTPLREPMRLNLPSPAIQFEFDGEVRTPTDRLLCGAKTDLDEHELQIFNTHLLALFMLKASSEEHMGQRELVLSELRASKSPTLIGGDFNVSEHDSLVRQFADAGYRTVQTAEVTWRRRPYVLDHIFYSSHLRRVRHEVKPTPASDHHMLLAEFEFVK